MKMRAFLPAALVAALAARALAAGAQASPPASVPPVAPVHTFASLAIAPDGDRVASIENMQSLTSAEQLHGPVIIRSARDGRRLKSIDPCPTCSFGTLQIHGKGQ
jgi:hypothetical protein